MFLVDRRTHDAYHIPPAREALSTDISLANNTSDNVRQWSRGRGHSTGGAGAKSPPCTGAAATATAAEVATTAATVAATGWRPAGWGGVVGGGGHSAGGRGAKSPPSDSAAATAAAAEAATAAARAVATGWSPAGWGGVVGGGGHCAGDAGVKSPSSTDTAATAAAGEVAATATSTAWGSIGLVEGLGSVDACTSGAVMNVPGRGVGGTWAGDRRVAAGGGVAQTGNNFVAKGFAGTVLSC